MDNTEQIAIFCRNIRYLRGLHHLSKKELAGKLGISVASLRKMESGILPPRLGSSVLFCIYDEFRIPLGILFSVDLAQSETV